jgi:hypothetical protein
MTRGMEVLTTRLVKLERENRRMKQIGIVAAVFVSVLFVSAQTKTNKIVDANEFRLVDGAGRVRANLSTSTYGEPLLSFNFQRSGRNSRCAALDASIQCAPQFGQGRSSK